MTDEAKATKPKKSKKLPLPFDPKKPPPYPQAPFHPAKPAIKPELEVRKEFKKISGSNYETKRTKLVECLKDVPSDVDLADLEIEVRYDSYYGSYSVHICKIDMKPNEKYKDTWAKYEKELAAYNEKMEEWKKAEKEYKAWYKMKSDWDTLQYLKAQEKEQEKRAAKIATLSKKFGNLVVDG